MSINRKMSMKDHYGRTIDYMRISITDRCNLRCQYCMPEGVEPPVSPDLLTFEEILLICEEAAKLGICKIKVTGGEPLVRAGCPELIGRLKAIPGIRQVTMTTNGVLIPRYLEELKVSGLDAVNISLDTLDEKVYREITGRDELKAVLEGIRMTLETDIPLKINCVLQKGVNADEWRNLIRFSADHPVDVRFIEMMPIGFGRNYDTVYNEEILRQLRMAYPQLEADESVHGNGPAVYYKLPGAKGSIGFISAMHGKFCAYCNRIRLTCHGKLKPCLCYEDTVDLLKVLRKSGQGDGEDLREKLRDAIREGICMKPESHSFEKPDEVTEQKRMAEIGG